MTRSFANSIKYGGAKMWRWFPNLCWVASHMLTDLFTNLHNASNRLILKIPVNRTEKGVKMAVNTNHVNFKKYLHFRFPAQMFTVQLNETIMCQTDSKDYNSNHKLVSKWYTSHISWSSYFFRYLYSTCDRFF